MWWISLRWIDVSNIQYQIFSATYGLMALVGAIWGISISKKWGGETSVMGKAILFFSFGLLAQEFGQLVYSAYAFFQNIQIPYPSVGDIGYFGSIPLYIMGVIYIAKACGISLKMSIIESKIKAVLIPLFILLLGYCLFLLNYTFDLSQPLKIVLDFGYPLGQAIYISLAIIVYLLSQKVLGGVMKKRIFFIIFALCVQFLSDYTYLFQSMHQLAYPGSINDLIYLLAYLTMTLSLLQFDVALSDIRKLARK
jgi:hypothetical protein